MSIHGTRVATIAALLTGAVAPAALIHDLQDEPQTRKRIGSLVLLTTQLEDLEGDLLSVSDVHRGGCSAMAMTCATIPRFNRDREPGCWYRAQIRAKQCQIATLEAQIGPFLTEHARILAEAETLIAGAESDVAARRATDADALGGIAACLQSVRLWDRELEALFSRTMRVLQRADRDEFNTRLRRMPGYRDRSCATGAAPTLGNACAKDQTCECWENEGGRLYYVTRGKIRIDSACLVRREWTRRSSEPGVKEGWDYFPPDPRAYLNAADRTYKAITGCLKNVNPGASTTMAGYLAQDRPILTCSPETAPTESDRECAHREHGTPVMTLTRPDRCNDLGATTFHELLHAGEVIGNFETVQHNDDRCRGYDGVYHCQGICFPGSLQPETMRHPIGCRACRAESQHHLCESADEAEDYDAATDYCMGGSRR